MSTSKKQILLTGGSGFIGSLLRPALEAKGFDVEAPIIPIEDASAYAELFKSRRWDLILHLAGVSSHEFTSKNAFTTFAVNVGGTVLIADLASNYAPGSLFVLASTAQVYRGPDSSHSSQTLTELSPIGPSNNYALSKRMAEVVLEDISNTRSLRAVVLRIFNHTHRSQKPDFFLPHVYQALSSATDGALKIPVGNLELRRDMGAVSDLVSAFVSVVENDNSFQKFEVFNVCSGRARKLRNVVELLASKLNVSAEFVSDQARIRAGEPEVLQGSFDKLHRATGWSPKAISDLDLVESFLS